MVHPGPGGIELRTNHLISIEQESFSFVSMSCLRTTLTFDREIEYNGRPDYTAIQVHTVTDDIGMHDHKKGVTFVYAMQSACGYVREIEEHKKEHSSLESAIDYHDKEVGRLIRLYARPPTENPIHYDSFDASSN